VTRALHVRLTFLLAAILIPAGVVAIAAALRGARAYHQEITQRTDADLAANLVAELGPEARMPVGEAPPGGAWAELVKMLAMAHPGVEIYVLDEAGTVVQAPSGVTPAVPRVALAPVRAFLRAQEGGRQAFPILGTDPRRGGRAVFSAAPLPGGGLLYVVLTDETRASLARSVRTSTSLRLVAWGGGLGLAVLLGVGALAFALLTRRLRRLDAAMRRFQADAAAGAAGPTDGTAPSPAGDEIDALAHGFDELTARVRAQVDALARADAARRDLVTNVSHDLRTPLTAVRGSLEALEGRLGPADVPDARGALDTARRNADRLERLIDHLFELSRLDGPDPPLRPERFALAELVHDVVGGHAGRAQAAGVRLVAVPPSPLPLLRGDLGQIERALANVLDNALRHTPAGGAVRVRVEAGADVARIVVEDEGEGIAQQHQGRVFERFYRVAPDRGGAGSGLGLAIARRIVELHGGAIDLVSAPGEGTAVTLTLPVAGPPRDPGDGRVPSP
jgi:signal transduction histidine kinase